jgi:cytochrome P450
MDHAGLLDSFDIYDEHHAALLHEAMRYARGHCPVPHSEANGGYFMVTRYDDVYSVLQDDLTYSSAKGKSVPHRQTLPMPPIDTDPPLHGDFRRLLNRHFSKAGLTRHHGAIQRLAEAAVERFVSTSRREVVRDFAGPFTASVLSEVILNLRDPEQIEEAEGRVEAIGLANDAMAWQGLQDFVVDLLKHRQDEAEQPDDVLSSVLTGQVGGRPLTDDERTGVVMVLMAGGLDTTKGAISNIVWRITQDAFLEERLRDPHWVRSDLDELLRLDSPVVCLARSVTRQTTLAAQPLQEGNWVLVNYQSANRDEARFPNADRLDFQRERNPHLAFGVGVHRCVGANLARLSIEVGFRALLRRVRDIRLYDEQKAVHFRPGIARYPDPLNVTFEVV